MFHDVSNSRSGSHEVIPLATSSQHGLLHNFLAHNSFFVTPTFIRHIKSAWVNGISVTKIFADVLHTCLYVVAKVPHRKLLFFWVRFIHSILIKKLNPIFSFFTLFPVAQVLPLRHFQRSIFHFNSFLNSLKLEKIIPYFQLDTQYMKDFSSLKSLETF